MPSALVPLWTKICFLCQKICKRYILSEKELQLPVNVIVVVSFLFIKLSELERCVCTSTRCLSKLHHFCSCRGCAAATSCLSDAPDPTHRHCTSSSSNTQIFFTRYVSHVLCCDVLCCAGNGVVCCPCWSSPPWCCLSCSSPSHEQQRQHTGTNAASFASSQNWECRSAAAAAGDELAVQLRQQ